MLLIDNYYIITKKVTSTARWGATFLASLIGHLAENPPVDTNVLQYSFERYLKKANWLPDKKKKFVSSGYICSSQVRPLGPRGEVNQATIQKMLDENHQLIMAIVDYQSKGECTVIT